MLRVLCTASTDHQIWWRRRAQDEVERHARRVDHIDGWTLTFDLDASNRRIIEALTSMGDGVFGRRGLPLGHDDVESGMVLASGVFDGSAVPELLDGPVAARAIGDGRVDPDQTVTLDLRNGLVTSRVRIDGGTATVEQFASAALDGVHVTEATGPVDLGEAVFSLVAPAGTGTATSARGAIAAASHTAHRIDGRAVAARVTALTALTSLTGPPLEQQDLERAAVHRLNAAMQSTTVELRSEHAAVWNRRWDSMAIDVPDRPDVEARIRFAQYHLLTSAGIESEAAIGARGATGHAYRGHVFWDTDVFVVPALAAMDAPRARSALIYRFRRLAAAKQRARTEGRHGARFPWESADSGEEVAPTQGTDLHGRVVPIKTGPQEIHIVADVAWSAMQYVAWTGDIAFARGPATDLLVETARYWQSRVERDADGTGHLRRVIGPDEYHESVDDNAFTNAMAAWNLRAAAQWCSAPWCSAPMHSDDGVIDDSERDRWQATADALVDGYDPTLMRHEQFEGYYDLDAVLAGGLGTPPLPADALLGRERIAQVQVIKQPDVLMLHHLLPDEMPKRSFEPDLDFYLPRTAHGSSLSPAITASLLARTGRLDEAVHWLDIALRLDLDDISHTTAGGLHLATMGGVWQAIANGFLGLRPRNGSLHVDPRVPADWGTITLRCTYHGVPVVVSASAEKLRLIASKPIDVTIGNDPLMHRRTQLVAERTAQDWSLR